MGPKEDQIRRCLASFVILAFKPSQRAFFGQLLESREIFQPGSRVFTPDTGLHKDEGGLQAQNFVRVKGWEGLEAPSLTADVRPCYFREGGRVDPPPPHFMAKSGPW